MTGRPPDVSGQRVRLQAVEAFSSDIERAISLRESFYQRELDASYVAGRGKIFWAIDPAVINAYFRNSDDQERWQQYSLFSHPDVQQGDEEAQASQLFDILVGMLIGRSGVARGQAEHRLLLLPSHTTEAKRAYDTVVQEFAGANQSKRPRERLGNFLTRLERVPAHERVRLAEESQAELHKILYGLFDAHQKFRTFSSALADRRLVTVKGARNDEYFERLNAAPRLVDVADGRRRRVREGAPGSEGWWKEQLRGMRRDYAENDAVALSRLYEINLLLEAQQCRVVLVTDNTLLTTSGQKIIPAKYDGSVISSDTFSDLYLRHPQSFLSERDILLPGGRSDALASMTGWLDAFLAKINIQGRRDLASFRMEARRFGDARTRETVARHALERFPAIHSSLAQDWANHVGNVLIAHVSTSGSAVARYVDLLGVENRDRVEILTQFESIVQDMTEASWSEFILSAAKSGYELVEITGDVSPGRMRNVPRLYLRGMPEGERLLALMRDKRGVVENAAEIKRGLDDLNTTNRPADFYVAALCLSMLFTYADRWPIASALANRAADIGDKELADLVAAPDGADWGGSIVTGREANYLACVTGRLSARSVDDLDRCERRLAQSDAAWRFEDEQRDLRGRRLDGYAPITGLRLAAERLSIATARSFFATQAAKWLPTGDPAFILTVRSTIGGIVRTIAESERCQDSAVRRAMSVDLRLNLFSNWLLLEIEGVLAGADTADAAKLVADQVAELHASGASAGKRDVAAIDAYSILYAASFDPDAHRRLLAGHAWAAELSAAVETRAPSLLMPYDRVKCRRMLELSAVHVPPAASPAAARFPSRAEPDPDVTPGDLRS